MIQKKTITHCYFGGYTLVEMVVSLTVMGIVMVGMGSVILVASQALPDGEGITTRLNQASGVLNQILEELHEGRYLHETTATTLAFTVADRDGDGSPETIRYAWSGIPGEPLTRQENDGSVMTLLEDVNAFDLAYRLTTRTETYPGPIVMLPETVMSTSSLTGNSAYMITDTSAQGQYFAAPALPPGSGNWQITRVSLLQRTTNTANGQGKVQIRLATPAQLPSTTILEEIVYNDTALPSTADWVDYDFTNVNELPPGQGLCVTVVGTAGTKAGKAYWIGGETGWLLTNDSGANWSFSSSYTLEHRVYGTAPVPDSNQVAIRQYDTRVSIALQSVNDPGPQVRAAVHLPNLPERLDAVWELDFSDNPLTLDMNGDGAADWSDIAGSFATPSLADGIWHVDSKLGTVPACDFTMITTATLRFRTTSLGEGARFRLNADWEGGTYVPIMVDATLQADGSQTINLYQRTASLPRVTHKTVSGLSGDFIDLRLLFDPVPGTVNMQVNGVQQGTYVVSRSTVGLAVRRAAIDTVGSAAEFESVSVRVGGTHP